MPFANGQTSILRERISDERREAGRVPARLDVDYMQQCKSQQCYLKVETALLEVDQMGIVCDQRSEGDSSSRIVLDKVFCSGRLPSRGSGSIAGFEVTSIDREDAHSRVNVWSVFGVSVMLADASEGVSWIEYQKLQSVRSL